MYPVLYDSVPDGLYGLGLGKLRDALNVTCHEELNAEYYLTFDYPITGPMYKHIEVGKTVGAVVPWPNSGVQAERKEELFDIEKIEKNIDGLVTVTAQHLSRRLSKCVCVASSIARVKNTWENAYPQNLSLPSADFIISEYNRHGMGITGFTPTAPKSALAFLIGDDESFLTTNDIDFWFYTSHSAGKVWLYVGFDTHLGEDRNASIRFGVNMLDLEHEHDTTNAINAYVPFWDDGAGNITYASGYIVQPTTPISPVRAAPLDCTSVFSAQPTSAQLVTYARDLLDSQMPWTGEETLHVDFVNGVEIDPHGADIRLGDTVHVYWEAAQITADLRVVAYDYDVLAERYISMELGTQQTQYVAVTGEAGTSGGSSAPAEAIDFSSQCTFPKGTPAHFQAFALGGLAFIYYQGPSISTYAVSDVLVTVPAEYAFDAATYGQTHAPCVFNTVAGTVAMNSATDISVGYKGTTSGNVRCYFQMVYPIV